MPLIDVQHQGRSVQTHALSDAPLEIGRARECAIHLADGAVSRQHARLEPQAGGHVLVDLGSRIGLWVNGEKITQHRLADGDRITIGPFELVYYLRDGDVVHADESSAQIELAVPMGDISQVQRLAAAASVQSDRLVTQTWQYAAGLPQGRTSQEIAASLLGEAVRSAPAPWGVVVAAGGDPHWPVLARHPLAGASPPSSLTIFRRVVAAGQALLCNNVETDRQLRGSASIQELGARSVAAVPLLAGGRVVAVLCLMRSATESAFSSAELHHLCMLSHCSAGWLAAALEKDRATEIRRLRDLPVPIIYRSRVMADVLAQATRVAPTDATVLILGPTGSGKELLASAIHYASLRAGGPLIKVNCAAIPDTLIESELFGHERGAFTDAKTARAGRFEQANGGTIFLDEIAEAPMAAQTKLLRVLEQRTVERLGGRESIPVDVRVIAATHRDVPKMVAEGSCREDLWYRLEVVQIRLPPLVERPEDVPLLFRALADHQARTLGGPPVELTDESEAYLQTCDWPGNVRQLRNVVERLSIFHPGERLGADALRAAVDSNQSRAVPSPAAGGMAAALSGHADNDAEPLRSLRDARTDFERRYIERALSRCNGNISRAADLLDLSRENLSRRIKQLGIKT
jgi:DNA-binding NtrC family response regulator